MTTPLPIALCERIQVHATGLASAKTADDALRSLFLLHCECRDAVGIIERATVPVVSVLTALPVPAGAPAGAELDEVADTQT